MRVALLHYTGPGAIGGVESMLAAQIDVLADLGLDVRLIVGEGEPVGGAELRCIPALHPSHPDVPVAGIPSPQSTLVEGLIARIEEALHGCDACWVHNAFTVYLHPALTVALCRLAAREATLGWVAWCQDLSVASAFWPALTPAERAAVRIPSGVRLVTISAARRDDMIRLLGAPPEDIRIIEPAVRAAHWLGLGDQSRRLLPCLADAYPTVLLPSKALPHKNLAAAAYLAAELVRRGLQPAILVSGAPSPHDDAASRAELARLRALATELGVGRHIYLAPDLLGAAPSSRTVRELMQLVDVVLLPSREEGFGLPAREAALLRAPLLCSDIPALREAAGEWARFFPLDAAPSFMADATLRLAAAEINGARRRALNSEAVFAAALRDLLQW